ncbi:hypothetical protein PsAD13_02429 [Pseudovibrio sp. Ad13]|uniref:hypothetical protein n=1 Tax=unclassified Pseudovibrio TaxID=2627060 RepID=UPI0007B21396|nr:MULTISPECIES: hypothetical protein [unclassified Pseudovibrio]KZK84061.1 hypothetical protein PsAD13_02429 [Pseudovibrio sp. Ad13]
MEQKLKSSGQLQRFLVVFSGLRNLIVPPHHQRSEIDTQLHRINALPQWKQAAMLHT